MNFLAKWRRGEAATAPVTEAAVPPAEVAVPSQRWPADEGPPSGEYADWNVLLDTPADDPVLGFGHYAVALVEIIANNRAEFAVGIFGTWGSGKTTLMRAIMARLEKYDNVVPVWFDAWRYEKEPNLILPLLDVLREALEAQDKGQHGWAHDAAIAVGHAGEAFLTGLSITANLPGLQAGLNVGQMIDALKIPKPLSYYHLGFRMLREAIEGLSANGRRRVVIFVDDLDRCVPPSALQVLESMKLFFDEQGCVFVVGLDQKIAERAVAQKYGARAAAARLTDAGAVAAVADAEASPGPATGTSIRPDIRGSDYIKKLFQVPFALPGIKTHELSGYLDTIEESTEFCEAQRRDFADNVRRHFWSLQGDLPVNPREIKLLLNMYVLQLKMFSGRPGVALDRNVMLALLCLNFRPDWQVFYDYLAADPEYTQRELLQAVHSHQDNGPNSVWLAGTEYTLPTELAAYLGGPALPVLEETNLRPYISAADSTWSPDPTVLPARIAVSALRHAGDDLVAGRLTLAEAALQIPMDVDHLDTLIGRRLESAGWPGAIPKQLRDDVTALMALASELQKAASSHDDGFRARWAKEAAPLIKTLDDGLRAWYRYIGLGL